MSPQHRSTDTAVLVRMTLEQRRKLTSALETQAKGLSGVRPVLSRFILDAALAEADRLLGKQLPR